MVRRSPPRNSVRRSRRHLVAAVVVGGLVMLAVVIAVIASNTPGAKATSTTATAESASSTISTAIATTQAMTTVGKINITTTTATTATVSGLSLMVEPYAGPTPLYALLRSARKTVDLVMYELEDMQAEAILAQDEARGVKVRVLLDKSYVGKYNQAAFSYLQAHQVAVRWAPSHFQLTHEKAMVIDDKTAAIMTLNFTAQYYSSSRDFAVIDTKAADVSAIETTFTRDWAGSTGTAPKGVDLLWSPGSEQALLDLISSSHHSLLVENEEMGDAAVTGALEAAARRGVKVEVVMTRQTSWSKAFDALTAAGVVVRTYAASAPLYIHAKAIVVDPGYPGDEVFIGSQNFSVTSLLRNRELGIITSDSAMITTVASVLEQDAAGGALWR